MVLLLQLKFIKIDGTYGIENGNHRLKIAKELGKREIPVKMVDSWENIGLNKENIEETGGIYNDGNRKSNNNINETSRDRVRSMYNYMSNLKTLEQQKKMLQEDLLLHVLELCYFK